MKYRQIGPLWSWAYGSWINNHLCNQFESCSRRGVLGTTLCRDTGTEGTRGYIPTLSNVWGVRTMFLKPNNIFFTCQIWKAYPLHFPVQIHCTKLGPLSSPFTNLVHPNFKSLQKAPTLSNPETNTSDLP